MFRFPIFASMFNKHYFRCLLVAITIQFRANAQIANPINGIQDPKPACIALKNASLHISADLRLEDATLIIRNGKIEAAGKNIPIPADATVISLGGKHVYPAFIDLWSGYGIAGPEKFPAKANQYERAAPGPLSWNMAIHPETNAASLFRIKEEIASALRKAGFATLLSHQQDGIARGSGALVSLSHKDENKSVLKQESGIFYSFDKGSSPQVYPSSQMGSIALLRQAMLDAFWYEQNPEKRSLNLSYEALIRHRKTPAFFEAGNWMEVLRADQIGDEFGIPMIIKSGGDDYQRLDALKASGAKLILPINYPEPWDLSDVYTAPMVPLSSMLHWEAAPSNPELVRRAGIPFTLTLHGLKNPGKAWDALRTTMEAGLPAKELLRALTETPAAFAGFSDITGDLKVGKIASFFISSDTIGAKHMRILETWVQGQRYVFEDAAQQDIRGKYDLKINGYPLAELIISGIEYSPDIKLWSEGKSVSVSIERQKNRLDLKWKSEGLLMEGNWSLNGIVSGKSMQGSGINPTGNLVSWTADYTGISIDSTAAKEPTTHFNADSVRIYYPNAAFGFRQMPDKENLLITNATIWTCDATGKIENASMLIADGKILAVGQGVLNPEKFLPAKTPFTTIDGTGMHITPGIIDEHSHIAINAGVNEGGQSITAEVRIGDVIDPRDRAIYYALAGGVTAVQQLHGSANAIGGQSSLIKLRWGKTPEQMKIKGAPGHIKFALGENVKQSNWGQEHTVRFPQTRMGVEQVYYDAFSRAKEYRKLWKQWEAMPGSKTKGLSAPARDLELDALVEILEGKRFITCHSYVQSEINMLMHVADSMGFKVNTFTHILEGYKVADKMQKHGAAGSTFSDWWAYKMEVNEAIPYNGALMHQVGVLTGFNSDDAEMGRRLNQEAAKAVLYGGVSEEEALKFITINPARMLHIDEFTGSLRVGKDADFVIWNAHPLSIYSKARATFIDGVRYFDLQRDQELQAAASTERTRLSLKMLREKSGGKTSRKPVPGNKQRSYECEDLFHMADDFLMTH
jgi:imidazolonepropionase-like amidohydrolase